MLRPRYAATSYLDNGGDSLFGMPLKLGARGDNLRGRSH